MNEPCRHCLHCGAELPPGRTRSSCAACVLEQVLPAADLESDSPMFQHFGSYELLEEIGRGGMGVIYRARQQGLDRVVALKMLLAGEFADARARDRLLREARIAARLTHPNIVTIHEVGQQDGRPYFAMEYVPGRNLGELSRESLLPVATAARYVEHLARAVEYAHQHGVIHRDLKPANVLISPEDEPKLTDFGLTKSLVDPTQSLESAGSPNFMAPEQADPSLGPTGTATDVYGLGAILYYLLSGRPPAVGETLTETLRAVVEGDPVPPRQLRPALSADLETIALRCLQRDATHRYGSAGEVAAELARWRRHEPIQACPVGPMGHLVKWCRRHPAMAGLAVTVVLTLLAGIAATTWQGRRAVRAAERAQAREIEARHQAYAADLVLADRAAAAGNWSEVRQVLERTRPRPGETDIRGWEWRYLWANSSIPAEGRFGTGSNSICSMAILPGGQTVALGEKEGGFSLWDVDQGTRLWQQPGPSNQVRHSRLSGGAAVICRVAAVPGTSLLAFTESQTETNGLVHLWDIPTRTTVRSFSLPGIPRHLAVSLDGRRMACSVMVPVSRVLVFDLLQARLETNFTAELSDYSLGHTLAFSADGNALSVEDVPTRTMRVMDLSTGVDRHRFPLDQRYPLTAAFSPDGRWLVTGAGFEAEHRVRVWDLTTGTLKTELAAASAFSLAFDATGQRLAAGLSLFRVPDFSLEWQVPGLEDGFTACALLPDGDTYLTPFDRGSVLRWRLSLPFPTRGGHSLRIPLVDVAFLPTAAGILAVSPKGGVYRAQAPRFECEPIPALGTNVTALTWLPDRQLWAVARSNGPVSLHHPDTWEETTRFRSLAETPLWLQWIPQSNLLGLVTVDYQLEIWDLDRSALTWRVPLLTDRYLTPPGRDGKWHQIHVDGRLFSYDPRERRVTTRKLDHENMHQLSFSPEGRQLLTTSPDGSMRLTDTRTWKSVKAFDHSEVRVPFGGKFWPQEPRLVFPGTQVVDLNSGRTLLHLKAEFAASSWAGVSEDGSMILALGMEDFRPCLWWAPSWEQIMKAELAGSEVP